MLHLKKEHKREKIKNAEDSNQHEQDYSSVPRRKKEEVYSSEKGRLN